MGEANGNGHGVFPPGPPTPVTIYRQPEPPPPSRRALALRILGWAGVVLVMCVAGVGGGFYLWGHEKVKAVNAKSVAVKTAAKSLHVPVAGQPA
ncbi:MAG: hypothetical protein ABI927_08390, partial [Gaiellaceae bacterium]